MLMILTINQVFALLFIVIISKFKNNHCFTYIIASINLLALAFYTFLSFHL